jgi:polyisoprenoid-binding protein YceI
MTRTIKAMVFAVAAMGLAGMAQAASGGKFVVEQSDSESRVQFVSDAPLEKISGVGHKLSGDVEFDAANLAGAKGTIELDVASIKTNVDLRDEHLRGPDWLDAAKYPKIKFEIKKVEGAAALTPNQPADLKIHGKLSMHGVTRDEVATAKVRWNPADGAKVTAQFKVNLTNYKVSVPSLVRLKVSDEIALNIMLKIKPKS